MSDLTREKAWAIREGEAEESARILGIANVMLLGNAGSVRRSLLIRLEHSWNVDQHARTKAHVLMRAVPS